MCRSVGREAMIREVRREISTKCLQRAAEAEAQANRQEDALTLKLARRDWVASIGLLHGRCARVPTREVGASEWRPKRRSSAARNRRLLSLHAPRSHVPNLALYFPPGLGLS